MHRKIIRSLFGALLLGMLSTALLTGTIQAQDVGTGGCPLGQGYWKNTATWPITQLVIGGQTYTQAELLILFNTPPAGDASINLAHQLVAAKLNLLNGSDATLAADLVTQADALLAAYPEKLPFAVDPSSAQGQLMINLAGVLDSFNSGQLTLNCGPVVTLTPTPESTQEATPEVTPESTAIPGTDLPITIVIEGPVQTINVNIITIYNINIQLDPNDPNLTVIQIGDIVRVAGNTQNINNTIIIVAVNVVIVNIDVNVDTGEFWRDTGNCDNPPPPWAPAHGWHRHCDGIIIIIDDDDNGNGMGMGMGNDD